MEKKLYKVMGISYEKLAQHKSIEDIKTFDIIGPGVETIVDAINIRKACFENYPGHYFTIRECTADECFITMSASEVDEMVIFNS